jgi:CHAT domain-containing protein
VLVSPDGVLGHVPLAALPGKAAGSYLIEKRSIAVVPVPRMLGGGRDESRKDRKPADTPPALLLAGDIDYGSEPGVAAAGTDHRSAALDVRDSNMVFKELKETRVEILAVRDSFEQAFADGRARVLRSAAATEEAIRQEAPKHRWLHLATHGYFAPAWLRSALGPDPVATARKGIDPLGGQSVAGFHPGLLSGIALAGANRRPPPVGADDGILTALEVATLDLSGCELAVLSACDTGLGAVAGGEGLLGLQRAFQVAGAGSVIASLWSVDDEHTRALMAQFYENLWRSKDAGMTPAAALRAAQLAMLRGGLIRGVGGVRPDKASDRLPPFYWAAFVLSTDRP